MITNFFRIDLPFEKFQIQRLPFTENNFRQLRLQHNHLASFFRNGEFIYISPARDSNLDLGDPVQLSIVDSPGVVLSLIRHLVFRTFRDSFPDRVPLDFSPLRFFSSKDEHDPLLKLLPDDLKGIIKFPRVVEVEVRMINENGRPVFGLLIRSRQRWQFNSPLSDLHNEGYDPVGKCVLESLPLAGLNGILAPREDLIGEIQSIDGGEASILTNEGIVSRPLHSLFLQRTQHQIGDYLAFRIGESSTSRLFQNLRRKRQQQNNPGRAFHQINQFAAWFSGPPSNPRSYENGDGFCFTVTSNNRFNNASSFPIQPTSLVFDFGPGASASKPLSGLSNFGPFNSERFASNELRILALCHSRNRGAMSQFAQQLKEGIPESQFFKRGLKSLFRLNSVTITIKEVENSFAETYEEAIDQAISEQQSNHFDLGLIECSESFRQYPVSENPYYRARVRMMSYGIPTQGVRDEHLRSTSDQLQWTLGPIALQMYAKAGGTPWRLPTSQSVDREIVVGIGSALERTNLWAGAEQSRIVGITTIFQGDGNYLLGERLRSVPYQDYFDELLSSLKASISNVAEEYAWKEGDSVRIVFHIFKPVKNIEAEVVGQLVESFPKFNILFSFVTISTRHPWSMYRNSFTESNTTTVTLCERGDNLVLDEKTCLLQLKGDKDRPNRSQRPPYPVTIRIHEKSTFSDLQYIAQQIHDFSFLSWRSFFPNDLPVTVFYSNLIASETAKLAKIPGWQPGFLETHFRRKQWFL